jgi:LysM repeat protein
MADRSRPRRSPARYLAPIALAAVAVGTYVVVHHALDGGSGSHARHAGERQPPKSRSPRVRRRPRTLPSFYVVRSGDSLSTISARTGIPLPVLETLNPAVAGRPLQVGQRLRLRR